MFSVFGQRCDSRPPYIRANFRTNSSRQPLLLNNRKPHRYYDLLTSTLFTGPVFTNYGGLIANEKFQPAGFAAPLGEKDIRLTLAAAETLRVPMPLASLVHDRLQTLIARGGEQLDWSALGQLAAHDAGLR